MGACVSVAPLGDKKNRNTKSNQNTNTQLSRAKTKHEDPTVTFAKSLTQHQREQKEYTYLSTITHFDEDTLRLLHVRFNAIDASIEQDGRISLDEFAKLINMSPASILVSRFFCYMDKHDLGLTFRTFAETMSVLSREGTFDEKLQLSFSLYDLDNDGYIHAKELTKIVEDCLCELKPFALNLNEAQIEQIVMNTIERCADKENKGISFDCYNKFVKKNMRILAPFSLDVQKLIRYEAESRRLQKFSKTFDRDLHHGPLQDDNGVFGALRKRMPSVNLVDRIERVNSIHNPNDICRDIDSNDEDDDERRNRFASKDAIIPDTIIESDSATDDSDQEAEQFK